jgi:biopolymer transport protein ExbB
MLEFFQLFNRGGWVMYVILAVSIYAVAVILYKYVQFARLKLSQTDFANVFLEQLAGQQVSEQVVMMCLARLRGITHPAARVLEAVLNFSLKPEATSESLREEVGRVGAREMAFLESHLRGLDLASNLAPFLGLLGMVLSMVRVFSTIESAGARVDVTLLAGGIWEALLTTVFGLIVAVIAQVGYHLLDSKVERARLSMNDASIRLIQIIKLK